jgi:NAD-dependent DNA ligase
MMVRIDRKIGGFSLSIINAKPNRRKSELYWIGFLSGLLASGRLETNERFPLIAEAEHFFNCLADLDAYELVQDLGCTDAYSNDEIFDLIEQIVEVRSKSLGELKIRDKTNFFLGQCAGVVCDESVLTPEARKILATAKALSLESKDPRILEFARLLDASLKDSVIDQDEELEIVRWIQRFVGDAANDTGLPTAESSAELPFASVEAASVNLDGTSFVLTGAFRRGPRGQIEKELVAKGATLSRNVTMNVRYIVVASKNSRDWKYHQYGEKIELALKYRDEGTGLEFLTEALLDDLLSA